MDTLMDRLTERMGELLVNQNRKNPNYGRIPNFNECKNLFTGGNDNDDEYIDDYDDVPHRRRQQHAEEDDKRRWKIGMQTEIPEFRGGLQSEEILD